MSWITGVAAEAGRDVGATGELEGADSQVAPGRQRTRRVAGSQLGGVLGESRVADVVQGLHPSVVPDPLGELGRVACSTVRLVTA